MSHTLNGGDLSIPLNKNQRDKFISSLIQKHCLTLSVIYDLSQVDFEDYLDSSLLADFLLQKDFLSRLLLEI